jgi:hypothetical protein
MKIRIRKTRIGEIRIRACQFRHAVVMDEEWPASAAVPAPGSDPAAKAVSFRGLCGIAEAMP